MVDSAIAARAERGAQSTCQPGKSTSACDEEHSFAGEGAVSGGCCAGKTVPYGCLAHRGGAFHGTSTFGQMGALIPSMVLDVCAVRWSVRGEAAFTFYRARYVMVFTRSVLDAILIIFEILGTVLRHSGERSAKIMHKSYCFLYYCISAWIRYIVFVPTLSTRETPLVYSRHPKTDAQRPF